MWSAADSLEAAVHRLVPVGMGVVTWLVVLLVVGALLPIGSVSLMSPILLIGFAVLFVPVYRFRPWEEGVSGRVLAFVGRRRRTLVVAAGLFVLVRLPVVSDLLGPLFAILLFPLRLVPQFLFGAKVFYAAQFGDLAGQLVFGAGRLYIEFLWLYALGTAVAIVLPEGGE